MSLPPPQRGAGIPGGVSDQAAKQLRGFGFLGLLALAVIVSGNLIVAPLSAFLVLVWARVSQTPWQSLGFTPPRSWLRTFALGIPFGIALKLVMKAVVMPLFGVPAVNQHYHYLAGNGPATLGMLATVVVSAGVGEEILFRGFLFERLRKLLGASGVATVATVLLTSGLFAVAHFHDQRVPGVEQAAVAGLVYGTMYAVEGRLWLPMVVHAVFDITAVALIYWQWESAVAHLILRS
jgi:membrane protease YdiL (CAAX protease family)